MFTMLLSTLLGLAVAGPVGGRYRMRRGRCYVERESGGSTPSHWWYVTEADEGPPLDAQDYYSEINKKQCQKVCDKDKYCTGFQRTVEDTKAKCIIFYESGPFIIKEDETQECWEKEASLLPEVPAAVAVDAGQGFCHTADDQSLVVPKVITQVENEEKCNIMCVKTKGCAGYNYGDDIEHKCRLWMTNKRVEGIMLYHAFTHCMVVRQKDGEWDYVGGTCTIAVQDPSDAGSWHVGIPFSRYYQEDLYNDDEYYSALIELPECKEHCDEDPQCIAFSSVKEGKDKCILHYEDGEWFPRDDEPEWLCYMRRKKLEPEPLYEMIGDGMCVGSKDADLKKVIYRGGAPLFADKSCQGQCDRTNNCHGWSVIDDDRVGTVCRIYLEPIVSYQPIRGDYNDYHEPCMRRIFNNLRAVEVAGSVGSHNYVVVGGAVVTLAVVGAVVASLRRQMVKEEGNPLLAA